MSDGRNRDVHWRTRDYTMLAAGLGTLGVTATVLTVAGGGFLLLISPLLLLFSPVLIPLAITATVVIGGALAFFTFIGSIAWLYNYATGGRPPLADQADKVTGKVKDTSEWASDKLRETAGFAQQKAQDTYGFATDKARSATGQQ